MATLVLGTVGRVFGGPVGGLIGTAVGGFVDRGILGGRRGGDGRIGNLTVQSAAYGEAIPMVTGRMRVAGNLIWSAGIVESDGSGGKRNGAATSGYTYTASFAVGLTGRPIADIGRIWADGRLIRGADGVFLAPTVMRLHRGGEAQAADPLIAAAEAPDGTPAYRGIAYVVFEDLPLVDFGNRIPNLTFEVIADAEPIDIGTAIAALAIVDGRQAADVTGSYPAIDGHFSGDDGSIADAVAGLIGLAGASVVAGARLRVAAGSEDYVPIAGADAAALAAGERPEPERQRRTGGDTSVDAIEIGYFDIDRDFQPGLQRARRSAAGIIDRRVVGAAMAAADAKALAHAVLARAQAARLQTTVRLPWRYLGIQPGALVRLGDDPARWRARQVRFEGFVVNLDLERAATTAPLVAAATSGRALAFDDIPAGPTVLHLFDLPLLAGEPVSASRLWVAAAGASTGWRRAGVETSSDDGTSYQAVGIVERGSVIGVTVNRLGAGTVAGWDRHGFVDVALVSERMWLESRPEAAVLAGANLALIGAELVQFTTVEALGPGLFRLSGLLRGRRGTEQQVCSHNDSERFILVDTAKMLACEVPVEMTGSIFRARATGPGDAASMPVVAAATSMAQRPLSPAHLRLAVHDGDITASWVRRSRGGFGWSDFVDAPLCEMEEAYQVDIWVDGARVGRSRVTEPRFTYARAQRMAVGGGRRVTIAVSQLSETVGPGDAVSAEIIVDEMGVTR